MDLNKKAKTVGLITSLAIHILLIVVLLLCAFKTNLPLPGEEGVEVMLGSADGGDGTDMLFDLPEEQHKKPSANSDDDKFLTSDSEEEVFLPEAEKSESEADTKNNSTDDGDKDTEQEVKPTPTINPNALYKGSSGGNSTSSGSTGDGDGGSIFGNPNSTNLSGLGGSGDGISFSLGGRGSVSLPKPTYNSDEQGKIVVLIHVNKNGDVIKAEPGQQGTTIADSRLWKQAQAAALRSKFAPDPKANNVQIGTITYNFKKINE
jgi:colicin import membrane protein